MHEPLSWEAEAEAVEAFKEDFIFADIIDTEVETKSMLEWMAFLPLHTFAQRHFENEAPEKGALRQAYSYVQYTEKVKRKEEEARAKMAEGTEVSEEKVNEGTGKVEMEEKINQEDRVTKGS